MKTLKQIKSEYISNTIDSRDLHRLIDFIPFSEFPFCGMSLKDNITEEEWNKNIIPFTREAVLDSLKSDVEFGFEKALNKRGISAGLMYEVVQMWNWILEEGLEDFDSYAMYGLPLFKATAIKYGFNNLIGKDTGTEEIYNT